MSRISDMAKKMTDNQKLKPDEVVTNFMGGQSYKINPLDTLKMVAASSIFGEPSYYRSNISDGTFEAEDATFEDDELITKDYDKKSTTEIFQEVIDKAQGNDAC